MKKARIYGYKQPRIMTSLSKVHMWNFSHFTLIDLTEEKITPMPSAITFLWVLGIKMSI